MHPRPWLVASFLHWRPSWQCTITVCVTRLLHGCDEHYGAKRVQSVFMQIQFVTRATAQLIWPIVYFQRTDQSAFKHATIAVQFLMTNRRINWPTSRINCPRSCATWQPVHLNMRLQLTHLPTLWDSESVWGQSTSIQLWLVSCSAHSSSVAGDMPISWTSLSSVLRDWGL